MGVAVAVTAGVFVGAGVGLAVAVGMGVGVNGGGGVGWRMGLLIGVGGKETAVANSTCPAASMGLGTEACPVIDWQPHNSPASITNRKCDMACFIARQF